jgi:hypothetical protein
MQHGEYLHATMILGPSVPDITLGLWRIACDWGLLRRLLYFIDTVPDFFLSM